MALTSSDAFTTSTQASSNTKALQIHTLKSILHFLKKKKYSTQSRSLSFGNCDKVLTNGTITKMQELQQLNSSWLIYVSSTSYICFGISTPETMPSTNYKSKSDKEL